jgi:hypothetical protein
MERQKGVKQEKRRLHVPVAGTLSVVAGLLFWEFVSRVVVANALFLAAPTQIGAAIVALALLAIARPATMPSTLAIA